jgi:hypothetical protein
MKRIVFCVLFILFIYNYSYSADSFQSITVSNTAIGLTYTSHISATYRNYDNCFCTLETAPIRVRMDGTAPTSVEGHLFNPGDSFSLEKTNDIQNFKAIRTTSTDAKLKCSCQ